MIQHIDVGDPAASSLSSCLCSFPGGFSLLTETGLLRPYLVASTIDSNHAVEAVEAATVQLSTPSQQGSFPIDRDVPVDHVWSRDGRMLVVLRRSRFSAYCRPNAATTTTTRRDMLPQTRPRDGRRRERPIAPPARTTDVAWPSLDLEVVHTGHNGFEGKVVACCLLRSAAAAATASRPAQSTRHTYLLCIGGTFGIECHVLDVTVMPAPSSSSNADPSAERHQQSAGGTGSRVLRGNATHGPGPDVKVTTDTELAATCQPLTSLFHGYPVVAIAISPDSGLVAAAALTGHVKVWEVASILTEAEAVAAATAASATAVPQQREPAGRGRRGKGKRSSDAGRVMRSLRRRRGSDAAVLWSVTVRGLVLLRQWHGVWCLYAGCLVTVVVVLWGTVYRVLGPFLAVAVVFVYVTTVCSVNVAAESFCRSLLFTVRVEVLY